jgi:antitoxin (DNA-binding transcriptional repressor) of toxin-antitoxin stability system
MLHGMHRHVADPGPALRSTGATVSPMRRPITQRELRNESGEIMRGLDRGEVFVVTRNGVAVGELAPFRRRRFVATDAAIAAFGGAGAIDADRFRAEIDAKLDQEPTPRV